MVRGPLSLVLQHRCSIVPSIFDTFYTSLTGVSAPLGEASRGSQTNKHPAIIVQRPQQAPASSTRWPGSRGRRKPNASPATLTT